MYGYKQAVTNTAFFFTAATCNLGFEEVCVTIRLENTKSRLPSSNGKRHSADADVRMLTCSHTDAKTLMLRNIYFFNAEQKA